MWSTILSALVVDFCNWLMSVWSSLIKKESAENLIEQESKDSVVTLKTAVTEQEIDDAADKATNSL